MQLGSEIVGIGIDLISWNRIERFLASHSFKYTKRLLTPSEQKTFRKTQSPAQFLARVFVAKEAYFKARGAKWMGEDGFRKIETLIQDEARFSVTSPPLESGATFQTEGRFFPSPDGIGAEVIIWRKKKI